MIKNVLYTAHALTTGGRVGHSRSSDGNLDVELTTPAGLGGTGGAGTNPEQLFAAGYSACFLSALKAVAHQQKRTVPADTSIAASVDIGPLAEGTGFGLAVALEVTIPGLDRAAALELVEAAHAVCPYSNATRGNIEVRLSVA